MSGSPKMVTMFVEGRGYVTVTERQAAVLDRMEKARGVAVEIERKRQLAAKKIELEALAEETAQILEAANDVLPAEKRVHYEDEIVRQAGIISTSVDAGAVYGAELALRGMQRRLGQVVLNERARVELAAADNKFDAEARSFETQLRELRQQGAAEFDQTALTLATSTINTCRALMNVDDLPRREATHAAARQTLAALGEEIETGRERRAADQQATELRLAEAQQLISGLQSDELAQRWAGPRSAELVARVAQWQAALTAGDATAVSASDLEELKRAEAGLLEQVAAAQLKAEQRDYILQSVREVLTEMGFMLSPAEAETPGHPASALKFSAVNAVGQSMAVSVPLEGEVWYDVEGFPMSTENKVGGGTAAVCDSAQRVIEEMHHEIEEQFGIKSGELTWEGKDPDRILRSADELPTSGDARERGGRP